MHQVLPPANQLDDLQQGAPGGVNVSVGCCCCC